MWFVVYQCTKSNLGFTHSGSTSKLIAPQLTDEDDRWWLLSLIAHGRNINEYRASMKRPWVNYFYVLSHILHSQTVINAANPDQRSLGAGSPSGPPPFENDHSPFKLCPRSHKLLWQNPVDSRRASIPCSETERTIILMVVLIKFVLNDRVHSGTSEPAAGGGEKISDRPENSNYFHLHFKLRRAYRREATSLHFFWAHCYCMCVLSGGGEEEGLFFR